MIALVKTSPKVGRSPTLLEAFALWQANASCRLSTARRYEASLRRLARGGLLSVADVSVDRVDALQRGLLAGGCSTSFVRTEVAAVRSVLTFLADRNRFPRTVLADLRRIAVPNAAARRRRRATVLSRSEVERLAAAARAVAPRLEFPLWVAVLSGLRVGELARVRAEDLDLERRIMRVVTLPEFGEAGSCKTGERTVPLCRELVDLLAAHAPRTGWLFPSRPLGERWGARPKTPFASRWSLETWLATARRAAELPETTTFLVLRHTRASWWLQNGASIFKVADRLGHLVATCEHYYASLLDEYDEDVERGPTPIVRAACAPRSPAVST